jgi:hypothetical protein
MVYERRQPRRSADDRLVDRFTRRETATQRTRRLARKRIDVPEEVINEFEQSLTADATRYARAIANQLTYPQETRTMATKRTPLTKKAEITPDTTVPDVKKVTDNTKPKPQETENHAEGKASKKATATTERAKANAKYTGQKLKVQGRCKLNSTMTYSGRVSDLDGQRVKVVGHESRGGVFVEFRGDRYVVSPHALLARPKTAVKQ